jgi:ferredoxin-NADP reductase
MAIISTFQGTVTEKQHLTPSVILLSLKIPNSFTFTAGQFVTLKMTNNGQTKMKSYSILNPPTQHGILNLCVKLIEGGFASEIFAKTNANDTFEIKGPFGHFTLDESSLQNEQWFIGSGTGVVPLYCMLAQHLSNHTDTKFILLFSVRTQQDLIFHQEFLTLKKKYSHFTYMPTLTREEWPGLKGQVQTHLGNELNNKSFYICGLNELVADTKAYLLQHGVDPKQIHFERYN